MLPSGDRDLLPFHPPGSHSTWISSWEAGRLLEDSEFGELRIEGLTSAAQSAGIAFHWLPVAHGSVPRDLSEAVELAPRIAGWAGAGENVVIHCTGGLGRAGTIGGCVLRYAGKDAAEALDALAAACGPNCPETSKQRRFVESFVAGRPARRSRVLGAVLGAAVGDALGHPTEFLSHDAIRRLYGSSGVTGFELWWERDGRRIAPYTDDTQMAEIVLRALVDGVIRGEALEPVMERIAVGFAHRVWNHRAVTARRAMPACEALRACETECTGGRRGGPTTADVAR